MRAVLRGLLAVTAAATLVHVMWHHRWAGVLVGVPVTAGRVRPHQTRQGGPVTVGAGHWDEAHQEWRTTVAGHGWHTVYAADGERVLYSGPDAADALAVADWYAARTAPTRPARTAPVTSLPASIHQAAHNLAVWDNDPRWRDDAACRGENPDLFFPTRGEDSSRAKSVCAHCPAITECAEYGMHEKHGIWGGMSERERRRERQRRRLPEPPEPPDDDMDKRLDQLAARLHATRLAAVALTKNTNYVTRSVAVPLVTFTAAVAKAMTVYFNDEGRPFE